MTMNDDTVIGRIEITQGGYREVTVRLSDLAEPYRRYFRDLADNAQSGAFERAVDRIAELEELVAHWRDNHHALEEQASEYRDRINELEAKLAEAEAALDSMQEAYEGRQ